jgi:hypothetical protein
LDMLNVYKAYSEMISNVVASGNLSFFRFQFFLLICSLILFSSFLFFFLWK